MVSPPLWRLLWELSCIKGLKHGSNDDDGCVKCLTGLTFPMIFENKREDLELDTVIVETKDIQEN